MSARVLLNLLLLAFVGALAVPVRAESGVTIAGTEIPWGVISTGISAVAAILTLFLRSSLTTMRFEFNSQMTAALKATAEKAKAEGVLEEKERAGSEAAARAAGKAEGKAAP